MHAGLAVFALVSGASLDLEWSAPASCPSVEVVRARLGALSGTARATVTERTSGWMLQVRANESVRELTTRSCEEAADAAVLIIQLALSTTSPDAGAPPQEPSPSVVSEPVAAEPIAPWSFHAAVHVGGLGGWLPQVLGHLGATFTAERGGLVMLVQAQTSLPQRYAAGGDSPAAVAMHLFVDVQAGACWAFAVGPLRTGPCGVVGIGGLSVAGSNVASPKTSTVLVPHGGAGLRASLPLGSWFELSAGLFGRASARPQVSFQGSSPVVEAGWASLEGFFGAGGFW